MIVVFAHYMIGCVIYKDSVETDLKNSEDKITIIYSVVLISGEEVVFDETGGSYFPDVALVRGVTYSGKPVEIPVSEVDSALIEKPDGLMTVVMYLGIIGVVVLIGNFLPSGQYGKL